MKKIFLVCCIMVFTLLLPACNKHDYRFFNLSYNNYLDTISSIRIEYDSKQIKGIKVKKQVESTIVNIFEKVEKDYSPSNSDVDSVVKQINARAGKFNDDGTMAVTTVDREFIHLLKQAINFSISTNGTFDVTVGALTSLWNIPTLSQYCFASDISSKNPMCKIPTQEEIDKAKQTVSYKNIVIDEEKSTVYLSKEGTMLDLGAIAKGYATDLIAQFLDTTGFGFYVLDLGGNIYVKGESKIYQQANKEVTVGIANPFGEREPFIEVAFNNGSVSTASVSERFIEVDNKRYSHILNPLTGYPVDNNLVSVSIFGPESAICDALATSIFTQGLDAIQLINDLGLKAILVTSDKKVYIVGELSYNLINQQFEIMKIEEGTK